VGNYLEEESGESKMRSEVKGKSRKETWREFQVHKRLDLEAKRGGRKGEFGSERSRKEKHPEREKKRTMEEKLRRT